MVLRLSLTIAHTAGRKRRPAGRLAHAPGYPQKAASRSSIDNTLGGLRVTSLTDRAVLALEAVLALDTVEMRPPADIARPRR
jgi:hypothetical protein